MKKYKDTDSYLADQIEENQELLKELREMIRAAAPEAEERFSYGMPGFYYLGSPLAFYACFKDHCSFFGASGTVLENLKDELKGFKTAKGTIQFTANNSIPADLIKKIVQARIKEKQEMNK